MTEIKNIDVDELHIDEMNVRSNPEVQKEMINSVKQDGVLQPLVVRPDDDGYGIVIGGRRYVAGVKADLNELPCEVRELGDDDARRLSLTENLMREDLSPGDQEQTIYEVFTSGLESGVWGNPYDMARKTFLSRETITNIVNRFEDSKKMVIDNQTESKLSSQDYQRTRVLKNKPNLRKQLLKKRAEGRVRATDLPQVAKTLNESAEKARERILSKDMISPQEARSTKMVYDEMEHREKDVEKETEEKGIIITFPTGLSKKLVKYAIDIGEEPEKATKQLIEETLEAKGYGK